MIKGNRLLRGGQILDYNARIKARFTNRMLKIGLMGYLLITGAILLTTSHDSLYILIMQIYADFLEHLRFGTKEIWRGNHGGISAHYFLNSPRLQSMVMHAKKSSMHNLYKSLSCAVVVYFFVIVFFVRLFLKRGEKYTTDRLIEGVPVTKIPKELITSVKKSNEGVSPIKLLKHIPLPKYSEYQGLMVVGSTGTGKTQAIMYLLDEIRRLGEPAIIYDKECTIKPYFFNEKTDVELNPMSELCPRWEMWDECANPMEWGGFASYLMPKSIQGGDPFWVDSARTIFTTLAWKIRDYEGKNAIMLLQLLLTTTLEEIREILKGTESENLVSKEIEKTAISIKSVLATYTKALRFLEGLDKSDRPRFSIKDWIKSVSESNSPEKGWLFITSRSKYHQEIKPLLSLWLGLAMQGIQSLQADTYKRIWLVIDETASLQRLETLSAKIADIRKFGGCVALCFQDNAQLDFIYGTAEAKVITSLLNTSMYFRGTREHSGEWASNNLGKQKIDEVQENQSYGTDAVRDGNSISIKRVERPAVSSTTIMQLENLECVLKVIGKHPILHTKIKAIKRKERVQQLVERKIDFDALEKNTRLAASVQNHPLVNENVKNIHEFEALATAIGEDATVLDSDEMNALSRIEAGIDVFAGEFIY